ncbi:hypothetical protein RWA01_33500 (plasmid) [Sinorhizobium meliloti]|uniref:hypothetical protein n=1 Tax=Rhizobium meliloti TaxID=382 RepID=UPI0019113B55|nr:hypothetical protein [Sinorhizobium meliloti]
MKIAALENNILAIVAGTFAATIAAEDIEPQFHALTHFPDRRARSELAHLAERLNQFGAYVVELWNKACEPISEAEIEAFARRHVDLTRRYWAAEGRCMNWFITGPAGFPVARNEKRMRISAAPSQRRVRGGWATPTEATASPSNRRCCMWFLPLSITLDVKRTRTTWQVRIRVQFWL